MVKTRPEPCKKEDMDKLIKASEDNQFYNTLFTVAKTTGRRLGEYVEVRVRDIDFETNIMKTLVLKRKHRIEKEAILLPEVARMLKQYIAQNRLKMDDYVFRKVSYKGIQYAVKKYAKKAGIKKFSFHNFRHYFVTELVRQGWHYDKIAKLTGHSSPSTLVHYDSAVASDIKEEALEALKHI